MAPFPRALGTGTLSRYTTDFQVPPLPCPAAPSRASACSYPLPCPTALSRRQRMYLSPALSHSFFHKVAHVLIPCLALQAFSTRPRLCLSPALPLSVFHEAACAVAPKFPQKKLPQYSTIQHNALCTRRHCGNGVPCKS